MVAVVLVALSVDPTDPNPKGTYALIFGIVGAYVFLLLAIQRLDIEAAARQRARPSIAPGTTIDNPMTVPEPDLWAALATGPIGDQAIRAHGLAWGLVRKSNNTAWIVCVLIFTCVPMTYMLESFVPVLVGAALIVLVSIAYLVGLAGAGGGELQDAYDAIDASLEPLGMSLVERPSIGAGFRPVPPYGLKSEIRGAVRFSGERDGRAVGVTMEGNECVVRLAAPGIPAFEAKTRDGKVRGKRRGDLPAEIEVVLGAIPGSPAWKGTTLSSDGDEIVARQKPIPERGWMPCLWLAERVADG